MPHDPPAADSSDFASLAARIAGLNGEQASRLVEQASASSMPVWQIALEQGQLNAVDVDIIKTLLHPQESIPGYEILDLIGRGGMGVVYRARQLSLNREVALKTILLSQVSNATAAARFENEAQLLARLTHPHIVAAFDFGRHAGRLFLAMELVEGKDVERLISHHGRLPERLVWHVIRQAAAGLAHAARVDVIHRDIKPANLLLVHPPDGFALPAGIPMVKIADFGLSILADDQQAGHERLTSASVHVGSPTYMAPEQLESGEIQHSADIFALGATAWHMLAGRAPLQGSGLRQLIMQRLTQPTDAIDRHASQVSPATVELLHDMLRIDASQRIAEYSVLLRRIDQILANTEPTSATKDPQLEFDTHEFLTQTSSQTASLAAIDPTRQ